MKMIRFIITRLRMRSIRQIFGRITSILLRYEMSTESFQSILKSFAIFSNHFGIQPTFPVTATVVKRHPVIFQKLQATGVEFAVHGFRHVDYTQLSNYQIQSHYHQAVQIFKDLNLNPSGFRFPFLRRNQTTLKLLADSNIKWDSSDVIAWTFNKPEYTNPLNWKSYLQILETYQVQLIQDLPSLPHEDYGLIEIPVSIPDDDILFERLKVIPATAKLIWLNMLMDVRSRSELLTLQLHPERFPLFKYPLQSVIIKAKQYGDCWIASLGEICKWWIEKDQFQATLSQIKEGEFNIQFTCSDRGQPMLRQTDPDGNNIWLHCEKQLKIKSEKKPIVGIPQSCPENLKKFLADEQIIFEITKCSKSTNLYINWQGPFLDIQKRTLLKKIQNCKYPLIRFSRWPKPYTFCLAITGDIDGIDLWDYWSRFHG